MNTQLQKISNGVKKYSLVILLGAFWAMAIAAPTLAATSVSFTPLSVSVRQEQTFTLTIGVNPQGVKNYTAKTELHYPANLLEVKSFTFASSWMPLPQSGYDLTDNTNGVLIKTAGYPGGLSSATTFGTVSFLAKKSGNGTIALNSNSFALDANNQNILAGASAQTAVIISAISTPIPTQTQTAISTPIITMTSLRQSTIPSIEATPIVQGQPTTTQSAPEPTENASAVQKQPPATQQETSQPLLASLGNILTLSTNRATVGLLVAIIILALIGYAIYTVIRKTRHKNK